MILDRRRFVLGSLAAAAACATERATAPVVKPPPRRTILILGGTGFLGPHIARAALARGHTITLFNRGKTNPQLFPDVEKLHGDRDGQLDALHGRRWDAVVDDTAYVPRIVKLSADVLAPNVGRYVLISTISVYKDLDKVGADESAPLETIDDPTSEDVKKNYGALKALCERAAEAAYPGKLATIRPGLIVGPGDPTGRFSHWPSRLAAGGEVIGPGDGTTPVQWIDVRDIGAWIVHVIEQQTTGTFTALGPSPGQPMKQVLDACNAAGGNRAQVTWVDAKFLADHGLEGWRDLPMWLDNHGDAAGFGTMANARALAAGLTLRPILDTAKATLAWLDSLPPDERAKKASSGIARDKEIEILAAWKSRS